MLETILDGQPLYKNTYIYPGDTDWVPQHDRSWMSDGCHLPTNKVCSLKSGYMEFTYCTLAPGHEGMHKAHNSDDTIYHCWF